MSTEKFPTGTPSGDPADAIFGLDRDAATTAAASTDGAAESSTGDTGVAAARRAPRVTTRPPVRVGTIVWGLVVVAAGVLVLAVSGGARVDGGAVAIGLLGGAGLALVLGSAVSGARRRRRDRPGA